MDTLKWYYISKGKKNGPYDDHSMRAIAQNFIDAELSSDILVWKKGFDHWQELENTDELIEITPPPIPVNTSFSSTNLIMTREWQSEIIHPWRRCLARKLDESLIGLGILSIASLLGIILELLAPGVTLKLDERSVLFNAILGTLASICWSFSIVLCNGFWLGTTGCTLGKFFFGIKILDENGRPPGIMKSIGRELKVYYKALALNIPLITLFTQLHAERILRKTHGTPWDDHYSTTVYYRKQCGKQNFLSFIGTVIGLLALISFGLFKFLGTEDAENLGSTYQAETDQVINTSMNLPEDNNTNLVDDTDEALDTTPTEAIETNSIAITEVNEDASGSYEFMNGVSSNEILHSPYQTEPPQNYEITMNINYHETNSQIPIEKQEPLSAINTEETHEEASPLFDYFDETGEPHKTQIPNTLKQESQGF